MFVDCILLPDPLKLEHHLLVPLALALSTLSLRRCVNPGFQKGQNWVGPEVIGANKESNYQRMKLRMGNKELLTLLRNSRPRDYDAKIGENKHNSGGIKVSNST